jgi:hypothetical protein
MRTSVRGLSLDCNQQVLKLSRVICLLIDWGTLTMPTAVFVWTIFLFTFVILRALWHQPPLILEEKQLHSENRWFLLTVYGWVLGLTLSISANHYGHWFYDQTRVCTIQTRENQAHALISATAAFK